MTTSDRHPEPDITEGQKIVSYSVNKDGTYEQVPQSVWQAVNVVNHQAWQEIEKKIIHSREKVLSGQVSSLHYYMTANQMNIGLLAQYTGQLRWQVWLHLIPFFFNRLSAATLQKYSELFNVTVDDLRRGRLMPAVYNQK